MKILKTWMVLDNEHHIVDTIEHEGKFWLVPGWLDRRDEGWSTPERIILLDVLPHKQIASGNPADFVVEYSIPKTVFDGQIPPQSEYRFVVIERPDIRVHFPAGVQ